MKAWCWATKGEVQFFALKNYSRLRSWEYEVFNHKQHIKTQRPPNHKNHEKNSFPLFGNVEESTFVEVVPRQKVDWFRERKYDIWSIMAKMLLCIRKNVLRGLHFKSPQACTVQELVQTLRDVKRNNKTWEMESTCSCWYSGKGTVQVFPVYY